MLTCNPVSCEVFLPPTASSISRALLTPCRNLGAPGWLSRVSLNLPMSSLEKHWHVVPLPPDISFQFAYEGSSQCSFCFSEIPPNKC